MSKELKYVECPNCGEVFDDTAKFYAHRDPVGINSFKCLHCWKEFKYPSHVNYVMNIVVAVLILSCLFAIREIHGFYSLTLEAILILSGGLIGIQGVVGQIRKNRLRQTFPDWENRLHNTTYCD